LTVSLQFLDKLEFRGRAQESGEASWHVEIS